MNPHLKYALETLLDSYKPTDLSLAVQQLSERYREGKGFTSGMQKIAYLAARMPATWGAIYHVLSQLENKLAPRTLLDLGAGPGTGMWAAAEVFSSLKHATLIEKDDEFSMLGKTLAQHCPLKVEWRSGDLSLLEGIPQTDLTLLSYVIGELKEDVCKRVVQLAWEKCTQALVIIEPGTPAGFGRIRKVRDLLISQGAHMIAPCPHAFACPIEKGDWCHFAARVERSALHRKVKSGELNYEDEKFSYVAVSKTFHPFCGNRILRHPCKHKGHVNFSLCTSKGIQSVTISKKTKEAYRLAKEKRWGDELDISANKND